MADTKRKTEMRWVKRFFTPVELQEKGQALARVTQELESLAEQKKSFNSAMKSKADLKEAEASLLSSHLMNGYQEEQVECFVEINFAMKTKSFIAKTTGEVVGDAPIDEADRQMELV